MTGLAWTGHQLYKQSPGRLELCYDSIDGIFITRADPVVWMSGQLLLELHNGTPDFVELECHCKGWILDADKLGATAIGDILRITDAAERRHVYVVRSLVQTDPEVWEVAWPE